MQPRNTIKTLLLIAAFSFAANHTSLGAYTFLKTNYFSVSEYSLFSALPLSIIGIWIAANISTANFLSKPRTKLSFRVLVIFALVTHSYGYLSNINWTVKTVDDVFAYHSPFGILGEVIYSLCLVTFFIFPTLEETANSSETFS